MLNNYILAKKYFNVYMMSKKIKKNNKKMRSFVLWYETKGCNKKSPEEEDKIDLDVHVNQWQSLKNRDINYFDFGLLIKDISDISKISFFAPFLKDKIYVNDLCEIICGSEQARLVNAIFNDSYRISCIENPKSTKIKRKVHDISDEFIVYSLSDEQLKYESKANGSMITIDLNKINIDNGPKEYYFRFRIRVEDGGNVIKSGVSESSFIQTLFTNVEVIDFRFNDVRSSVNSVVEDYLNGNHFNIKKLHYLILRNEKDEFLFHGEGVSSRILEDELWHEYFKEDKDYKTTFKKILHALYFWHKDGSNDVIAYHFKKKVLEKEQTLKVKNNIETFTRLVRFRYSSKSLKSILFFGFWSICVIFASAFVCIFLDKVCKLFGSS